MNYIHLLDIFSQNLFDKFEENEGLRSNEKRKNRKSKRKRKKERKKERKQREKKRF